MTKVLTGTLHTSLHLFLFSFSRYLDHWFTLYMNTILGAHISCTHAHSVTLTHNPLHTFASTFQAGSVHILRSQDFSGSGWSIHFPLRFVYVIMVRWFNIWLYYHSQFTNHTACNIVPFKAHTDQLTQAHMHQVNTFGFELKSIVRSQSARYTFRSHAHVLGTCTACCFSFQVHITQF